MDDRDLLERFDLSEIPCQGGPALSTVVPSQSSLHIYIFTKTENAQRFFLNLASAPLHGSSVFILPDVKTIPAQWLPRKASVYLLSTANYILDKNDINITDKIWEALYRYFVIDAWGQFARQDYRLPLIMSDDPESTASTPHFLNNLLAPYIEMDKKLPPSNTGKLQTREGILVQNTENGELFNSLYETLRFSDKPVYQINNNTGWVSGRGLTKEKYQDMNNKDFADYLIQKNIGMIYFINYYFMAIDETGISRLWVLKRLGVIGISVIVDMVLDGMHPIPLRYLPNNIHAMVLHSTENFHAFLQYRSSAQLHKCPQIAPSPKKDHPPHNASIEGLVVTSNSRLFFLKDLKNQGFDCTLLYPLFHQLLQRQMPIYHTYFIFLHALGQAGLKLSKDRMLALFKYLTYTSIVLRTFVRYELIQKAAQVTERIGLPFKIYGDDDWQMLFPKYHQNKYLNQTELAAARQNNINLDATPSSSFYSQHPVIPLVLLGGGSILAPAPYPSSAKSHPAATKALKRFYFNKAEDMKAALFNVLEKPRLDLSEQEAVSDVFGVSTLIQSANHILQGTPSNRWDLIPTLSGMIPTMPPEEYEFMDCCADYVLALFQGNYQRRHPATETSEALFQQLALFGNNRNQFFKEIQDSCPYLENLLIFLGGTP